MALSQNIANSIQEVRTRPEAPLTAGVLEKLKDIDAQRIAKSDDLVMRKGVLALFGLVAELEACVEELQKELAAAKGEPGGAWGGGAA